jgi:hypothetical protein
LISLSAKHALLPDSIVISGEIESHDSGQPHPSGGFADVKQGRYKEHMVAVKTMRVAVTDHIEKIREVSRRKCSWSRDKLTFLSAIL